MVDEIKGGLDELASNTDFTVEIDGTELALDLRADDLHPLIAMAGSGQPSEEDLNGVARAIRTVLYRTHLPHWDRVNDQEPTDLTDAEKKKNDEAKEKVESVLRDHYVDIVSGIAEELGWDDGTQGDTVQAGNLEEELRG